MVGKKLTVVIVTFQSAEIIKFCLEKINREKYEVILVDNNSSDKTLEIAAQFLPAQNIIKLERNSGFGRGNNAGLKQVKTEYALVLNPDAFIKETDIEKVLEILEREKNIAIAGATVCRCVVDEKGNLTEFPPEFGKPSTSEEETEELYFTRFVTGAAMFLRMEVFRKIGFFDEEFFLYCEDNEICKRAIRKGHKVALIKTAKFFHCSGQSSSDRNYKIFWHRFGWSKAYYFTATRGIIVGKLGALRITLKYLVLMAKSYFKKEEINPVHKYSAQGAFAYLIGKKAFDKNGNPYIPN